MLHGTPRLTEQHPRGSFTLLDGSNVTVSFMNAELPSLPATQGTNFVAASLPYADTRLSLMVVVPNAGQFSQVESSLNATALAALVAALTSQQVLLTLPRFKVETGTSLVALLQALGMTSPFIPGVADFSGMDGTHNLFISDVIHKAFIDVAEKGTEPQPPPPWSCGTVPPPDGATGRRDPSLPLFPL